MGRLIEAFGGGYPFLITCRQDETIVENDGVDDDTGTLSKDDDDGSENVAKKRICVLSNLISSTWTRSICQM